MFETEMPAKREFKLFPTPERVARLAVKSVIYLISAAFLYVGGMWALNHSGVWSLWHHSEDTEEAEAATPPPQPERHKPPRHAATTAQPDQDEPQPERHERPRHAAIVPQQPKPDEQADPPAAVGRMIDETESRHAAVVPSEEWRPGIRLPTHKEERPPEHKKPMADDYYRTRGPAGTGCQPWVSWCRAPQTDDRELMQEWREKWARFRQGQHKEDF